MTRWFRFYDEALNDPKVQRLSGDKFKVWVNLLCLASRNGGVLPTLSDISFSLRLNEEKVSALLNSFCESGLIDPVEVENAAMSYEPHNWNGRQYKSDVTDPTASTRQKRYRNKKRDDRNADRNATVTPKRPETETETETETEQKTNAAPAAPDPEVDLFRRGKQVLGKSAGGMIKQLLDAKDGKTNLARAAIETAAGKENPREYVGKIIRNQDPPPGEVSRYVDGRL